jgi:small subunit ribosomal protein S18
MKKKVDIIARDNIDWVDYKDVNLLRRFMSERGKIRARRVSGLSAQNQRAVAHAIKIARELALLPYANRTVTERVSVRSRRGDDLGEGGGDLGERRGPRDRGADVEEPSVEALVGDIDIDIDIADENDEEVEV